MSWRERRNILTLAESAQSGALLSLVRAAGSTYRRPGARLMVLESGTFAGTLSGGCLEAELLRKAAWKVRDGARMEQFSTSFEDVAEIPYGLGCGGEVDLLMEPILSPEAQAWLAALQAALRGETSLAVTILPENGSPFGRIIVNERGDVSFASEWIATEDIVDLRAFLRQKMQSLAEDTFHLRNFFLERIQPPQRVILFGAGEDARPLADLCGQMGWQTVVADQRAQHARAERFPHADVTLDTDAASLKIGLHDAVVIMTHSFQEDGRLLAALLPRKPRYLGLLGARHRSSLLLVEAAISAHMPLAEACKRVHAPVGLDLGGDGPDAIALAVVAEIQATLHHRAAATRTMQEEEVRALAEQGSPSTYTACSLDPSR